MLATLFWISFHVDNYDDIHTFVNPTSVTRIGHHWKGKTSQERLIGPSTL